MKKIVLEENFYNGKISPNAVSLNRLTILLDGNNTKEVFYREYYNENYNHETVEVEGEIKMIDEIDNLSDDIQFEECLKELQNTIQQITSQYKADFYKDDVPYNLHTWTIRIDNQEYKYGDMDLSDDAFADAVYFVENFNSIFKLNNKMFTLLLSSHPFNRTK